MHWNVVKLIFNYLKSTQNFGTLYSNVIDINVIGYWDADYAGDILGRRFTSRSVFCVGKGYYLNGAHRDRNQCHFLLQSQNILR